ncbi:MAG: GFA family protein [Pseudomonadota bacterium]
MAMTGKCLCGAVTVTLEAKETVVDACHCGMCRKLTGGGPAFALHTETGARPQVAGEDAIRTYASSDWAERAFCGICGTPLWYRFVAQDFYSLSAGLFDPAEFDFRTQIFVEDKPNFYDFANKTKMMTGEEVVAAFTGGTG